MANIKYLYISDINNQRIVKIRADNLVYARSTVYTGPHAIAFDDIRNIACDSTYLYASDTTRNRISQIKLTDLYYRTEGYPPSEIAGMSGVLLVYSNLLYVVSYRQYSYVEGTTTIFTSQCVIRKYSLPDMTFISQTDLPNGTGMYVHDTWRVDKMATDGTYLYITDTTGIRVAKFSLSGFSYVTHWSNKPPGWPSPLAPGGYSSGDLYPSGIATDGTYVYVTDILFNRYRWDDYDHLVKLRCSDLSYVSHVGRARGTNEDLKIDTLYNAQAVVYDGGFVYLADSYNARIQKRNASDLSFVSQTGSYGRRGMPSFDDVGGVNVFYYPWALAIGEAEEEFTVVKEWNYLWENIGVNREWHYIWMKENATPVTGQWNYLWEVTPVNKLWTVKWSIEMLTVTKEWNCFWDIAVFVSKLWTAIWEIVRYVSREYNYLWNNLIADTGGGIVVDAGFVLSAFLYEKRKMKLNWTFGSNADFQVFWKSSVPPGQEYALLATTNAFSFTTPDLEPSKTYTFYVRANVGVTFFYSNTVELFVSCGKGVVLSAEPPPKPPAQWHENDIVRVFYDQYSYRQDSLPYGEWWQCGIASSYISFIHLYWAAWNGSYTDHDHLEYQGIWLFPLDVPPGATIESAYLSLYTNNSINAPAVKDNWPFTVKARAVDNCPDPELHQYPVADNNNSWFKNWSAWFTNNSGTFVIPPSAAYSIPDFTEFKTSNLKYVLQEIVSRPGWVRGNTIGLYMHYAGQHIDWNLDSSNQSGGFQFISSNDTPGVTGWQNALIPYKPKLRFSYS